MSIESENSVPTEPIENRITYCRPPTFLISKIGNGDLIPVGGKNMFNRVLDKEITCDLENNKLVLFLNEAHEFAQQRNLPKIREWLDTGGWDINEGLFATLFTFNKLYAKRYPTDPNGSEIREGMYRNEKAITLSSIFERNVAECAEIAALAQVFLQNEGITSVYVGGSVLWELDLDPESFSYPEPHAFLIIHKEGHTYIYDPSNPINFEKVGYLPAIYEINGVNFEEEMIGMKGNKLITAKEIYTGRIAYFGGSDFRAISPEKDII
jgi:hypothetical protein